MRASRWLLIGLLIPLLACATKELPPFPVQPVDQYRQVASRAGLAVAVQTITEKELSERFFGVDLVEADVLAVLVVAENRDTEASFVLWKGGVWVTGLQPLPEEDHERLSGTERGERLLYGGSLASGAAMLFPPAAPLVLGAVVLPLFITGTKTMSDASVIEHNLAVNELRTTTLSPGRTANGLVYFDMREAPEGPVEITLEVQAMNLQLQEVEGFPFTLLWHQME